MQVIVVDNFTAFDYTGIGPGLRGSPSAALGSTDGCEARALAAGKGVTLRCGNADFPVQRKIIVSLRRGAGRHTNMRLLTADAGFIGLVSIEQGQQQRQYDSNPFHVPNLPNPFDISKAPHRTSAARRDSRYHDIVTTAPDSGQRAVDLFETTNAPRIFTNRLMKQSCPSILTAVGNKALKRNITG